MFIAFNKKVDLNNLDHKHQKVSERAFSILKLQGIHYYLNESNCMSPAILLILPNSVLVYCT